MIRVVFTGSESTGKSTTAVDVAGHYGVNVVPEFVRAFAAEAGRPIEFGDHGAIARGQMALEDQCIARVLATLPDLPAPPALLIQDTDLLSTVVYCRHYFGHCPAWIEDAAAKRRPDVYLLCAIDTPWVADGIRDRGHLREEMQALFEEAVRASGSPFVVISGSRRERQQQAIAGIDRLLAGVDFA